MYRGPSSAARQCCTCSVHTHTAKDAWYRYLALLAQSPSFATVQVLHVQCTHSAKGVWHRYLALLVQSPSFATVQVLHVHTLSKRHLPQVRDNSPSHTGTPRTLTVQMYHCCNPSSATQHSNVQVVCYRNSAHATSTDVPQL